MTCHPLYGGAPYRKPDGCPCCRGKVVLDPRLELCERCWNRAVRLMDCRHEEVTDGLQVMQDAR